MAERERKRTLNHLEFDTGNVRKPQSRLRVRDTKQVVLSIVLQVDSHIPCH
jgi:hypothetical protein